MLLKDWREREGLDRTEVARQARVTVEAIRLYEMGQRIPQREIMVRLREISDGAVTANDFYEDTAA